MQQQQTHPFILHPSSFILSPVPLQFPLIFGRQTAQQGKTPAQDLTPRQGKGSRAEFQSAALGGGEDHRDGTLRISPFIPHGNRWRSRNLGRTRGVNPISEAEEAGQPMQPDARRWKMKRTY